MLIGLRALEVPVAGLSLARWTVCWLTFPKATGVRGGVAVPHGHACVPAGMLPLKR